MQTDWLIDFMTLAQTRSFSRSAQLRHITQPAFSRRIRSLEAWASADLVDRSCHPPSLTQAGRLLYSKAPALVASIQHTHTLLRAHAPIGQDLLRFACPPLLAFHFFPAWICRVGGALGDTKIRLTALDPREALQHLNNGDCDLLLAYDRPELSTALDTERCEMRRLDRERLVPCVRPGADGRPMHVLAGKSLRPLPYLAHSAGTGLDEVVTLALKQQQQGPCLHRVFESNSPETLKAMALAGQGIAFLPERSVQAELLSARLVPAGDALDLSLDICILRTRSVHSSARKPLLDHFWARLRADPGAPAGNGTPATAERQELIEAA